MLIPISLSRPGKSRRAADNRSAHVRRIRLSSLMGTERLEDRLALAVATWSGAVDNLWSTDANWDVAPNPGDTLVFPVGASNLNSFNDLPAGLAYDSIAIDGAGYAITGNALEIQTAVTAFYAAGTASIDLDMTFTGATPGIAVVFVASDLAVTGKISTANPLSKSGAGRLSIDVPQEYSADTVVFNGTLVADAALAGGVKLSPLTALSGSGPMAFLESTSGTVLPGLAGKGTMSVAGATTFDAGTFFRPSLMGSPVNVSSGKLVTGGPVDLGSASLEVALEFVPIAPESFTIIDNTGSGPIGGTFAGLPEGSLVDVGGFTFRISYVGGTGNDVTLTHQVVTTTSLTTSVNPSVYGQSVTLVAGVGTPAGAGTPTGSVQFYSGATLLSTVPIDVTGTAIFVTSALELGTNQLKAVYLGEGNYLASTSQIVEQEVTQAESLISLSAAPNPSQLGDSVTLTATVQAKSPGSGVPAGDVEFYNDGVLMGTGTLDVLGKAQLTVTGLPLGTSLLRAVYQGSPEFSGSTSLDYPQVVEKISTTTTVVSSLNPADPGVLVTFTATVAAVNPTKGIPAGSASFYDGTTLLATVPLSDAGVAVFSTSSLSIGTHPIKVTYEGNDEYASSNSAILNQVINKIDTTTLLTSSLNPSKFGDSVTFTAVVTPELTGFGTLTGNVVFRNGTTTIGTIPVDATGTAVFSLSTLAIGTSQISAVYQGDTNYVTSTSNTIAQVVNKASSAVTLTSSASEVTAAGMVTFTASVNPANPNLTNVPTGQVRFLVNGQVVATRSLVGGEATYTTNGFALGLGVDTITAEYVGDTTFEGSASDAVTVVAGTENERWLNQVYLQVVFRPIDYQGLTQWNDRLQRGSSRACVVTRIRNTPEGRQQLVQQSFIEYLGREGTADEIRMVTGAAQRTRTSPRAIILGTPEFYNEISDGTPEGYVLALEDVLGTTFSPRGSAMIVHQLQSGQPPFKVAEMVLTSRKGRQALIQQMFQQVLGRDATERELAGFTWQQTRNVYWRQQQSYLLASEEFYQMAIEEPGLIPGDF